MQPFTWTATFPLWWKRGQRAYCCAVQDTQRMLSFVPYIINIGVEIPNKQTAEQRHGKCLRFTFTLITIRMISQVWGQRATDVKSSHYPRTSWHSTTDNVLISHSLYSFYGIWRFGSSLSLFRSGVCVLKIIVLFSSSRLLCHMFFVFVLFSERTWSADNGDIQWLSDRAARWQLKKTGWPYFLLPLQGSCPPLRKEISSQTQPQPLPYHFYKYFTEAERSGGGTSDKNSPQCPTSLILHPFFFLRWSQWVNSGPSSKHPILLQDANH